MLFRSAAATVNIAPADTLDADGFPQSNTVDTNRVIITGSGTINSFGQACGGQLGFLGEIKTVTKRINFQPTVGQSIILHHNLPTLNLLGAVDRTITTAAFGEYQSDANGNWQEIGFSASDTSPVSGHGGLISLVYYAASATVTIPPLATRAWVRMWGGSGGSASYYGAGAGAGGYLEKYLIGLGPGKTLAFTCGAAGAGGLGTAGSPTSDGKDGTASTLASGTQTIGTLTANAGKGVIYQSYQGSLGGTATGGDVNVKGQNGTNSCNTYSFDVNGANNGGATFPGAGGSNFFSKGADGVVTYSTNGNPGVPGGMIIAWYTDPKL